MGSLHPNVKDLTGQRFGRWTVVSIEDKRARYGNVRWLCLCDCGTERVVVSRQLIRGTTKSCGRGECHHHWKGGRSISTGGYIMVWDKDHLNTGKNGYVYEHVAVMSKHLGRPLLPEETVHHLNGVRDDNRLENLELWSSSHPPGQRITDKIKYWKEMLAFYETP